ncbi:phosphate ABC transporter substrate-binding protein [Geomicrobium sp. JSM 1781026]|uniref:phosphate ABC transporter substrate-binding protein n=1 Tax=Geomicrobium sp. JSM 1781026 TaxID=3344580 RepID=UPI0035BEC487
MKKHHLLKVTGIVALLTLAACDSGDSEDATATNEADEPASGEAESLDNEEASNLEGTVTISGSTSVQPISEELAVPFMEENPDTRIEVSGGGSGAGVTAAQQGASDFGAVSREIAEDETGIEEYVIALDGIAIIVHPDNALSELALEDVTDIFSGEVTNWSEIGGDDADIVVVSREDGSGTRDAFTDIVLGEDDLIDSALIQNTTGGVAESVANDPFAVGYMSTGSMSDSVQGLNIDGAEPTDENIRSGEYPVSRPFNYVSNENEPLSEVAQAFLDFILGDDGQQVVEDNGFISVD